MRVLVCGGRHYSNGHMVGSVLAPFRMFDLTIIQGGATGADRLALEWAKLHQIEHETFAADWSRYGSRAGPIRNQRMIDEGKPDLVIAFAGGRGTADMIRRARAASIPVEEYPA